MQAIGAGCHVLVEKPIALNLNETDQLIELARKRGVKLSVVHNVLFRPVVVRARSLVEKGLIGDVIGMSITQCVSRYGYLVPNKDHWCHKLPGGIFGEMLPHSIYLATAFMKGMEVAAVHKQKLSSHSWMAADELRVILKGDAGVSTITNSANGLARFMALDLMGTRASMYVNVSSGALVRHIPVQGGRFLWGLDNIWAVFQYLTSTSSGVLRFLFRLHHNEHHNLIKEFIQSIRDNTDPPVTLEEAREVIRIYQDITSRF
jgi:predicted dehydrogenase